MVAEIIQRHTRVSAVLDQYLGPETRENIKAAVHDIFYEAYSQQGFDGNAKLWGHGLTYLALRLCAAATGHEPQHRLADKRK